MRFLIDNALSPVVASVLCAAGHDAVHIREYKMQSSPDDAVFARAAHESRILVSADTDFGTILALREELNPSVILLRRGPKHPTIQAEHLLAVLPIVTDELQRGCIVVLDQGRIRVRRLPIGGAQEA